MLDIIIENKKIIRILLIIAFIIIFIIIWIPEKEVELAKYNKLTEDEIDNMAAKQYGEEFQFAVFTNDIDLFQRNVLFEYLQYNEIVAKDYQTWLVNNKLINTSISINETNKYEYGNKVIYSMVANIGNKPKTVNIIETAPEKWNYTFDTFINYHTREIKEQKEKYGVAIKSIYQDLNYIEFKCSLNVDEGDYNKIDVTKSDNVILNLEDGTSVIMATNNNVSETTVLGEKKYINIDCIFNLPIDFQDDIKSIKFDVFEINGKDQNIEVNIEL